MEKIFFNVGKNLCDECALALRRFIGHIKGVDSIDVNEGNIVITFNDAEINGEELSRITKNSIERLGYKLIE